MAAYEINLNRELTGENNIIMLLELTGENNIIMLLEFIRRYFEIIKARFRGLVKDKKLICILMLKGIKITSNKFYKRDYIIFSV